MQNCASNICLGSSIIQFIHKYIGDNAILVHRGAQRDKPLDMLISGYLPGWIVFFLVCIYTHIYVQYLNILANAHIYYLLQVYFKNTIYSRKRYHIQFGVWKYNLLIETGVSRKRQGRRAVISSRVCDFVCNTKECAYSAMLQ